jgi:hypothetical protein
MARSRLWFSHIRDKTMRFRLDPLYRVVAAIYSVRRRHRPSLNSYCSGIYDHALMIPVDIPYPHSQRPSHKKIPIPIDPHTIRNARFGRPHFSRKDPSVTQVAACPNVIHADIASLAIINVQAFPVG